MSTRARAAVAACLAVVLSGCGGGSQPTRYDPQTAQQLKADAAKIRAAATEHRTRAARHALDTLTRHVAAAQADGQIPRWRARAILRAAHMIAADLAAISKTSNKDADKRRDDQKPKRGEKPEGWEAHKDGRGDQQDEGGGEQGREEGEEWPGGEKPEGWEAHKKEE